LTRSPIRWIYHLVAGSDANDPADIRRRIDDSARFAPASLRKEGFLHGSFRPEVRASGQLYFQAGSVLWAIPIDPRRVDVPVEIALTPRGPMPHVRGSIPRDALGAPVPVIDGNPAIDMAPDAVVGTRIAFITRGSTVAKEAPDADRVSKALMERFGGRIALIPVDIENTTAVNSEFDVLLFMQPSARSWASGLPRTRRVFAAGPRLSDDLDKWLSFAIPDA
jgi:uncharacterized protein (DUF952 family)